MRLTPFQQDIIKDEVARIMGEGVRLLLLGSRTDDSRRGGDIDLYLETPERREQAWRQVLRLNAALQERLGEQKLDIGSTSRANLCNRYICRRESTASPYDRVARTLGADSRLGRKGRPAPVRPCWKHLKTSPSWPNNCRSPASRPRRCTTLITSCAADSDSLRPCRREAVPQGGKSESRRWQDGIESTQYDENCH
ncbi:MAG: hypothetical protein AB1443_02615 [Pseudomonadota bacterium]